MMSKDNRIFFRDFVNVKELYFYGTPEQRCRLSFNIIDFSYRGYFTQKDLLVYISEIWNSINKQKQSDIDIEYIVQKLWD